MNTQEDKAYMKSVQQLILANKLRVLAKDLQHVSSLMRAVGHANGKAYSAKLQGDAEIAGRWIKELDKGELPCTA